MSLSTILVSALRLNFCYHFYSCFADVTMQHSSMFSPRRQQKRPLGYYVPESRLELQVEKAMFRTNAQIIRDMCEKKIKQKQKEMQAAPLVQIPSLPFSDLPPELRWLLTRSARMRRVNNAGYSKFRNPVNNRVVSANGRRGSQAISLQRQRTMCSRISTPNEADIKRLQCDVLGPYFCTDCTKLNKKNKLKVEQNINFPRLEVHTRSLVAPDRVEKLYLSHPKELFHQDRSYKCGCAYNPALEITTPLVYTPHEVFQRLRTRKYLEKTAERVERERENTNTKRNSSPAEKQPSFYDEKTLPPMDLKVSVVFRNDG